MKQKVVWGIGSIALAATIVASVVVLWPGYEPAKQPIPDPANTAPRTNQNIPTGIVAGAESDDPSSLLTNISPVQASAPLADTTRTHTVMATIFWVGETPTSSNAYIPNVASAWDGHWQDHYGGVDAGTSRCGFLPCAFTPSENPFYVALPYNDLDEQGHPKSSALHIPWTGTPKGNASVLKNRWIAVSRNGLTCYGQWEDVGPYEHDDYAYVFGAAEPKNQFGQKAGLDISPAVRDCLGMKDNAVVDWKFTDEQSVPAGPWKARTTNSPAKW